MRSAPDASTTDITACDREAIHVPGAIQAHGVLFALERCDHRITAVSANVEQHLGHLPASVLDLPISDLVDKASAAALTDAVHNGDGGGANFVAVSFLGRDAPWRVLVHRGGDRILVEAKLPHATADPHATNLMSDLDAATRALQGTQGLVPICERLAQDIRRLTGYGRVKVYRFGPDWSGEVLAEARAEEMPSYLGLHFPASDIPAQARALYALNPERQIPDVNYTPVPVIQSDVDPIDLSRAALRSVSPIHIEYLRNMGVAASMSLSVMRDGRLWGLIACHHPLPHYVPPTVRQAALLLTQIAAWQMSMADLAASARRGAGVKAIEAKLLRDDAAGRDYREALLRHGTDLLDLLQASGAVLSSGRVLTRIGRTPAEDDLKDLVSWLSEREPCVFATDHLALHYPAAASFADVAAGILAVPLGAARDNVMVWFRPEIARTVTWGGDPEKPVEVAEGQTRLSPRKSFAAWTEEVRGRSRPWDEVEVSAANGLRDMIVDIILRHAQALERMNDRLVRSNEELEAFAYVASHDLKEPLRQIETFGTMLERAFKDRKAAPDKVERWFKGIQSSSRRLRVLIDDLAAFSKLGREARAFVSTALGTLLDAVLTDLSHRIEESRATIVQSALPTITCDPVQMRQVLQNLVENAIKYRHPDRAPVITITGETGRAIGGTPASRSVVVEIADNGIGFDERHRERIFEPFQRLHSAEAYEGSGIGLAICRKIVDRHGGTIAAQGRPGKGSTFQITLPVRSAYDRKDRG